MCLRFYQYENLFHVLLLYLPVNFIFRNEINTTACTHSLIIATRYIHICVKNLDKSVCSSTIYNKPKLKTAQVFIISNIMNKHIVELSESRILCTVIMNKVLPHATYSNMNEFHQKRQHRTHNSMPIIC